jgi:hypothetical protein
VELEPLNNTIMYPSKGSKGLDVLNSTNSSKSILGVSASNSLMTICEFAFAKANKTTIVESKIFFIGMILYFLKIEYNC